MAERPLTAQQELFVAEYLIDLKSRDAAIRAGYSPVSAASTATALMNDPRISAAITEGLRAQIGPLEQLRVRAIREIACMAFADPLSMVNVEDMPGAADEFIKYKRVTIQNTADIPVELRPAISSIKQGANGIEVKFYDKAKSLELLGKFTGLVLPEKLEVSGPGGGPINLGDMPKEQKDKLLLKAAQRAALG